MDLNVDGLVGGSWPDHDLFDQFANAAHGVRPVIGVRRIDGSFEVLYFLAIALGRVRMNFEGRW